MSQLAEINKAAGAEQLCLMGAFHPQRPKSPEDDFGTCILLGTDAGFWPHFAASPEARDSQPDPVDRWSTRVIGALATRFAATARYPFGGPPYQPFLRWAQASGRCWSSPVGMLVHDHAGMMISFRGALLFAGRLPLPKAQRQNPCLTCPDQPCTTACPVGALSADASYDVAACHRFLDTPPGSDCLQTGCASRRACPVSQQFGRPTAQSAHHMLNFHPP